MTRTRRLRALLGTSIALAVVGTLAAVLPARSEPTEQVGTAGPALGEDHRPSIFTTEPTIGVVETVEASSSTSTTAARRSKATTTTQAPTSTFGTTPPQAAGMVDNDAVGPGPHDLLGRVVYLSDEPDPSSLWSRQADGSGKRREVACPPAVPDATREYPHGTFDVSPDGRYVVRSCPVIGTDLNGIELPDSANDLVIQDVDGAGMRVLWRYHAAREFAWPEWSPDGTRLAVSTGQGIIVMQADGTGRRTLAPSEPVDQAPTLTWSPDGTKLVTSGLAVVDIATGAVDHPVYKKHPWPYGAGYASTNVFRWSPEGIWFGGAYGKGGSASWTQPGVQEIPGIWRIDPDTGVVTEVARLANYDLVRVQAVSSGWWSCTGGSSKLQRISADGTFQLLPDQAWWVSAAGV